jgi:hypothetical protein
MVRAGSRSVVSEIDEALAAEVSAALGREVSGAAVRRHRDYGALVTERATHGDRRKWRYGVGAAALVGQLETLKAGRLRQDEAILVSFLRGCPLAERGVRRAYREFYRHNRAMTIQRWGAETDLRLATERATSALRRTQPGRVLQAVAGEEWSKERERSESPHLSRGQWVDAALHSAMVEPVAVAAGRAPQLRHTGEFMQLLQAASSGLPGSEILNTMRDPAALELLKLLELSSLSEQTQQVPYEDLLWAATTVHKEELWAEGRDLIHAMIDTLLPGEPHDDVRIDLVLASVGVPAVLVAKANPSTPLAPMSVS